MIPEKAASESAIGEDRLMQREHTSGVGTGAGESDRAT